MKILVITFSKGLNPGTFMQAYGVKTGLLKIFPNANINYLNFPDFKWNQGKKNSQDSWIDIIKQKGFAAYRLLKYKRLEHQTFNYTRSIDLFSYNKEEARSLLGHYDLIVVGSDTILEKVYNNNKQMGLNWASSLLCNAKHVFFAASASPANFADDSSIINQLDKIIKNFSYIGLRDQLTINLFKEKLKIDDSLINKQPDPSYLLDIEQFKLSNYYTKKILKIKGKGDKIAFYNFSPNFPFRKTLAEMIKKAGYKIVTSVYNPYADIAIDTINAKEWAGIFKYCDITITERFHDSLFSIRNGCPVIAIDWEKDRFSNKGDSKTYRILQDYNLEKHHFNLKDISQLQEIINDIPIAINDYANANITEKCQTYVNRANELLYKIKQSVKE